MKFEPLDLAGACLVIPEPFTDERGFFSRVWCDREFGEQGLSTRLVQCNISFNLHRGTVRGMHYQAPPHAEDKLVRVTRGAIHDVIVDLRPTSPTFLAWRGFELDQENRLALFVPKGFAHGFQTLTDDTEVFYQMSEHYVSEAARGFAWNDARVDVKWPLPISVISQRDHDYPPLNPADLESFCAQGEARLEEFALEARQP